MNNAVKHFIALMKALFEKTKNKWQVIIPARLTGTGKRKRRFFDTREQAEAEVNRWKEPDSIVAAVAAQTPLGFLKINQSELIAIQAILDSIRRNAVTVILAEGSL